MCGWHATCMAVSGPHSSAPVVISKLLQPFIASHLGSSVRYQLWGKVCSVNSVFLAYRSHELGYMPTPPA